MLKILLQRTSLADNHDRVSGRSATRITGHFCYTFLYQLGMANLDSEGERIWQLKPDKHADLLRGSYEDFL